MTQVTTSLSSRDVTKHSSALTKGINECRVGGKVQLDYETAIALRSVLKTLATDIREGETNAEEFST